MSAETVDNAGMPQLRQFHMVSIKELHGLTSLKCNTRQRSLGGLPVNGALNSDQVISKRQPTGESERAPGPGLMKSQATSKSQAASVKLSNQPEQASSNKPQAPSCKHQASSRK